MISFTNSYPWTVMMECRISVKVKRLSCSLLVSGQQLAQIKTV